VTIGRRAQRLNRQSSTRSVRAEAALRYTPAVPAPLLLVSALIAAGASLLIP
jgi:hypothetical protein